MDYTEVSPGLILFIANELDDKRERGVITLHVAH